MNEAVLTEIITRLLMSPEIKALLEPKVETERREENPRCLILVNSQADINELPAVTARYSPEYDIAVCVTGQVELTDSRIHRVAWEQAMQEGRWQRLYIPACSRGQLAEIALGLAGDKVSQLVAWAITQGLPVEIGRIHWGFTDTTPASYRQLFAAYAEQVAGFGVILANPESDDGQASGSAAAPPASIAVPEPVRQTGPLPSEPVAKSETRYEKKLLTDREAVVLAAGQIVRIAKATVMTPAAIDTFKQQKTEVYREGVRCI